MKLYELSEQYRALSDLMDSCDNVSQESIKSSLSDIEEDFSSKVQACLSVRQNSIGRIAGLTSEVERFNKAISAEKSKISSIEDYIKTNMKATGLDRIDAKFWEVSLRKPTKKLGNIDESKVSGEFWTVIPETRKLDKRALLKAAKDSPIDGVEVVDSERALTIK